jgi:hypothetical protein
MRESLERSIGAQAAVEAINELTRSLEVRPFDFIGCEPDLLVSVLAGESPHSWLWFCHSALANRIAFLSALSVGEKVVVMKLIYSWGPSCPQSYGRSSVPGGTPESPFVRRTDVRRRSE